MHVITSASEIPSERLGRLYAYWRAKAAAGAVAPQRAAIDATEIRRDLPWVWLADVLDSDDFGMRLAGERIREFFGPERVTRLSTCPRTTFFNGVRTLLTRCVETRAPVFIGPMRSTYDPKEYLTISALAMPLSENGRDVTMLIGGFESEERIMPALDRERLRLSLA